MEAVRTSETQVSLSLYTASHLRRWYCTFISRYHPRSAVNKTSTPHFICSCIHQKSPSRSDCKVKFNFTISRCTKHVTSSGFWHKYPTLTKCLKIHIYLSTHSFNLIPTFQKHVLPYAHKFLRNYLKHSFSLPVYKLIFTFSVFWKKPFLLDIIQQINYWLSSHLPKIIFSPTPTPNYPRNN